MLTQRPIEVFGIKSSVSVYKGTFIYVFNFIRELLILVKFIIDSFLRVKMNSSLSMFCVSFNGSLLLANTNIYEDRIYLANTALIE